MTSNLKQIMRVVQCLALIVGGALGLQAEKELSYSKEEKIKQLLRTGKKDDLLQVIKECNGFAGCEEYFSQAIDGLQGKGPLPPAIKYDIESTLEWSLNPRTFTHIVEKCKDIPACAPYIQEGLKKLIESEEGFMKFSSTSNRQFVIEKCQEIPGCDQSHTEQAFEALVSAGRDGSWFDKKESLEKIVELARANDHFKYQSGAIYDLLDLVQDKSMPESKRQDLLIDLAKKRKDGVIYNFYARNIGEAFLKLGQQTNELLPRQWAFEHAIESFLAFEGWEERFDCKDKEEDSHCRDSMEQAILELLNLKNEDAYASIADYCKNPAVLERFFTAAINNAVEGYSVYFVLCSIFKAVDSLDVLKSIVKNPLFKEFIQLLNRAQREDIAKALLAKEQELTEQFLKIHEALLFGVKDDDSESLKPMNLREENANLISEGNFECESTIEETQEQLLLQDRLAIWLKILSELQNDPQSIRSVICGADALIQAVRHSADGAEMRMDILVSIVDALSDKSKKEPLLRYPISKALEAFFEISPLEFGEKRQKMSEYFMKVNQLEGILIGQNGNQRSVPDDYEIHEKQVKRISENCSGVLIPEVGSLAGDLDSQSRFVLTARHCVIDDLQMRGDIVVDGVKAKSYVMPNAHGLMMKADPSEKYSSRWGDEFYFYNEWIYSYSPDIAIIELESPIPFSNTFEVGVEEATVLGAKAGSADFQNYLSGYPKGMWGTRSITKLGAFCLGKYCTYESTYSERSGPVISAAALYRGYFEGNSGGPFFIKQADSTQLAGIFYGDGPIFLRMKAGSQVQSAGLFFTPLTPAVRKQFLEPMMRLAMQPQGTESQDDISVKGLDEIAQPIAL